MRCGIFIDNIILFIKSKLFTGIVTGIISGVISGYMVSEYYKKIEMSEQEKYNKIALADIGYTLKKHIAIYQNMYKATAISLDERDNNIDRFFQHFFTKMIILDLEKDAPEINYNKYTLKTRNKMWITYLEEKVHLFRKEIKYKLDKYMIYLKPQEIDMIKKLGHNFYDTLILITADNFYKNKKNKKRSHLYNKSAEKYVLEAFNQYKTVIKYYEKLKYKHKVELFDKKKLFYNNISPKMGSGRIELTKD